jgi:polyhydroxyalkanoate synthase subunit PhaC
MSNEPRPEPTAADSVSDQAARSTLALNPLVGLRSQDLFEASATVLKAIATEPAVAARQWLWFIGELGKIAAGQSERSPQAGDRRFADPTWKSSNLHRSLLQAYLALGSALDTFVDQCSLSDLDKARARLATTIMVDALAPTNTLLTNPAALKQLIDSGGESVVRGFKNYIGDLVENHGLPAQVDKKAFKVGDAGASVLLTNEDIAFALGFSDAANFRHAFRRWTKKTPREFRLMKSAMRLPHMTTA